MKRDQKAGAIARYCRRFNENCLHKVQIVLWHTVYVCVSVQGSTDFICAIELQTNNKRCTWCNHDLGFASPTDQLYRRSFRKTSKFLYAFCALASNKWRNGVLLNRNHADCFICFLL